MATLGPYDPHPPGVPNWLNKGDNAWQMTAATLVGLQSVPGLVILYGSIVKKKWAVNSAFMALYAFAAVLIVWVLCGYRMAFGERLLPFWGKAGVALSEDYLYKNNTVETPMTEPFYPMATLVYFEFMFAAITVILLAGSLLGRMNIKAWMAFAPLWLIFSYTVGAFSLWGGGFLYHWGSSTTPAAIEVLPEQHLADAHRSGLLWMGWSGFNGGAPYAANTAASMAVLNTNICAATSLLVWTCLDVAFFKKPSVIGAVQGMMTGLVCITPGAGLVHGWAAIVMGMLSGSIPWFTMMILHKNLPLLQKVDDTLAVFHTHAPELCNVVLPVSGTRGVLYGGGAFQLLKQLVAAGFVIGWNIVVTTLILLAIRVFIPLRMPDEQLMIGDDAAHGEEAYALWGDGERYETVRHSSTYPADLAVTGARGLTIQL
ncbi:unnamed protein product [Spirodela intermedia]|uniref:Ammonium transporter AmtB-like domain-containing protein n=1 Tax=Spirodela intermedia TaxID=51605 RepID=A0A7I8ICZ3_SPIIN|nr:unnamed protein product [Spirodela intermedia]CAA6654721.1 unnamed protein product [Spirodela intermedia]